MNKRINITLPDQTIQLLDRIAPKGDRSRLIDHAIKHYIKETGRARLRQQLAEGAKRNAERDLEMTAEWFNLEEEVWQESNL